MNDTERVPSPTPEGAFFRPAWPALEVGVLDELQDAAYRALRADD